MPNNFSLLLGEYHLLWNRLREKLGAADQQRFLALLTRLQDYAHADIPEDMEGHVQSEVANLSEELDQLIKRASAREGIYIDWPDHNQIMGSILGTWPP